MADRMTLTDQQAHDIIYAIIERACIDYMKAYKDLKKYPYDYQSKARMREVENFFRSDWYADLMPNVNADKLIKRLVLIIDKNLERGEDFYVCQQQLRKGLEDLPE